MAGRLLPSGRIPHVCIIGAGMAGLRCTEYLIQKGMKATLLEGRDRIGGRVHQSNYLGHPVDLGPNWIHGTDHNPILDLAHETGTIPFSFDEHVSVIDESGKSMSEEKAGEFSELTWGIIADAFKHSNNHSATIPPDQSLMDFFKQKVDEKALEPEDKKTILQMASMWGAFVGDPIERQSLKFFWLEECIDGENLFVASTYKAILDRVARTALEKADVRLNTKVISVESKSKNVLVTIEGGSTLEFDDVVVTAPLGWLKRNTSAFSPPLSSPILRAIKNISYGRLEKVYITFPTAFWDPTSNGASPPPSSSTYPFFTHFLPPTYAPSNPHSWNIELAALSVLPSSTAQPTLLFYIHGPCATHITSLIRNLAPSSPTYYARLNTFFKPYYSLLPHFSTSAPSTTTPTRILATEWQNDELAGWGSYTNFQISNDAGVQLDRDIEALREGEPERGLWFAGEHTAPFVALGTVTGAWWSGEGVGRRVAEKYGLGGAGREEEEEEGEVDVKGKMQVGKGMDGGSTNGMGL